MSREGPGDLTPWEFSEKSCGTHTLEYSHLRGPGSLECLYTTCRCSVIDWGMFPRIVNSLTVEKPSEISKKFQREKKIFLIKNNNNSQNISRNFSGAVVGSMGSVQFQIASCSSLHISISIGLFWCSRC